MKTTWRIWTSIIFLLLLAIWILFAPEVDNLSMEVQPLFPVYWFENESYYFLILAITYFPVTCIYLLLKPAKWKLQQEYILKGTFLMAIPFLIWDLYFTRAGVWGFNPFYLSGTYLGPLPLEEVLFFLVIPYATLLLYWVFEPYIIPDMGRKLVRGISFFLSAFFLLVALFYFDHLYTATVSVLMVWLHTYVILKGEEMHSFMESFWILFLISVIPFFIINGMLTGAFSAFPVVMYNETELLGLRIGTIPVEDLVYNYLMLFTVFYFSGWRRVRGPLNADYSTN